MALDDESELLRTHPHMLAYFPQYALWTWFIALGVVGLVAGPTIADALRGLEGAVPGTGVAWSALTPAQAWFFIWAAAAVLPAFVVPFFRISFSALFSVLLVVVGGVLVLALRGPIHALVNAIVDLGFLQGLWDITGKPVPDEAQYENLLALAAGVLGVIVLEFHRGSRTWIITNRRLIARFGILNKSERDLLFSQVDDIVIHQTLLGGFFNFGTVIPLSSGGLAADSVESDSHIGRGSRHGLKVSLGSGKHIVIPREATFYMLWGVKDPRGKKDLILGQIGGGGLRKPVKGKPSPSGRAGRAASPLTEAPDSDND